MTYQPEKVCLGLNAAIQDLHQGFMFPPLDRFQALFVH
jgi:hypothetical protein